MGNPGQLSRTARMLEVVECCALTQREMGEDVAQMQQAVTELTTTAEAIVNRLDVLDELRRAVEQLGDAVTSYTGKLGALYDLQRETSEQLGRFIQDAAKQQSGIRDVDRRLRAIEGGLGNGSR